MFVSVAESRPQLAHRTQHECQRDAPAKLIRRLVELLRQGRYGQADREEVESIPRPAAECYLERETRDTRQ